jgi:phosphatidylserine decarboxylase
MTPAPPTIDPAIELPEPGERQPLVIEPLEARFNSIQPGGGWCMRLELSWGRVRRALLKRLARRYIERMRQLRHGEPTGCPHEVLDPRDLKYFQNRAGCWWDAKDDPFAWRDHLPLVRVGLAEAILLATPCLALAAALSFWHWLAALPPGVLGLLILWFFRNPRRVAPTGAGLVVAPADGRIVSIREIERDPFLGAPAIEVGIFLSIFNVHVNRIPVDGRIIGLSYRPGKFHNALLAASAHENERVEVRLEETGAPHRRFIVRQIAGAIASRIVCWTRPGAVLNRGEAFGMIKFGSRTELVLPHEPGLQLMVQPGQRVRAGVSVLVTYACEHSN